MNPSSIPAPAGSGAAPHSPRVQQALLSLRSSRSALRVELLPPPQPPRRHGSSAAMARLWWRRLRGWPAAHMVGEAARQWWQGHPWRPLGDTLIGEARAQLWPLVRRHPWASMGTAAALGAATVALRPWRWAWLDRQLRRAPAAASGWLVRQLASAPVQATIASLLALAAQAGQGRTAQPYAAEAARAAEPPAHPGDPEPAAPGREPAPDRPDRVREPDEGHEPPVREPRRAQS